jgi:hypothetical protein
LESRFPTILKGILSANSKSFQETTLRINEEQGNEEGFAVVSRHIFNPTGALSETSPSVFPSHMTFFNLS